MFVALIINFFPEALVSPLSFTNHISVVLFFYYGYFRGMSQSTIKKWAIEVDDWTKSNPESLRIIHSKAEEYFQYTHTEANDIKSKAFTFISILTPVVYFILGYFGKMAFSQHPSDFPLWFVIIICVPALICIFACAWIIKPRLFMLPGRDPRDLARPEFVQSDYTKEEEVIALLMTEIEWLHHKVQYNKEANSKRIKVLSFVMHMVFVSVAISIVALGMITFF